MEENFEEIIDLKGIFQTLRQRWKLIFISTMTIAILFSFFTLFLTKPKYETSVKLFIGKEQGSQENYNSSDVQMYQQLLKTYSQVIRTRDMAKAAIEQGELNLEVEEVLGKLSVETLADTQILKIKYASTNPEEAFKIIKSIESEFIKKASELVPNGNVQQLEGARFPEEPISPNKKINITLGLVLGLSIGIGVVFLIELLDNTFKSKEQIERELDIPLLGAIPKIHEE